MKKTLSILLASAIAAAPLSVNAFAENQNNCGIRDALEKIITVYKGTYSTTQNGNAECGAFNLVQKLAGMKDLDLGCLFAGNCNGTENGCGDSENCCNDGECENAAPDVGAEIPGNSVLDWENIFGNIQQNIPGTELPGSGSSSVQGTEVSRVVELVNSYRAQNGLSPVTYDEAVGNAAVIRAAEQEKLFSHTRPNGTSCFTALDESGVSYRGAGENIAMGQTSANEVMTNWMNSSGHRENILNGSFTKIGVGLHIGADGRYYWAQMFTY